MKDRVAGVRDNVSKKHFIKPETEKEGIINIIIIIIIIVPQVFYVLRRRERGLFLFKDHLPTDSRSHMSLP